MANGVKYRNSLASGDDGFFSDGSGDGPTTEAHSNANPRAGSGPNHWRTTWGNNRLYILGSTDTPQWVSDAAADGVFMQFCFNISNVDQLEEASISIWRDGTSSQDSWLTFHITPQGGVTLHNFTSRTSSQGVVASLPDGSIQDGVWHCVSLFLIADQAAGEIVAALDGAEFHRDSGIDTWPGNGSPATQWGYYIEFDSPFSGVSGLTVDFTDAWFEDGVTDIRKPIYFAVGRPDTDTVSTATGVGDAVNLHNNVDDDPLSPNDADYNDHTAVSDETRHGTDLSGVTGTVLEVSLFARVSDPSGSSDLIPTITEGGTTTDGANMALTSTPTGGYRQSLATNPRTAAAWTPAEAEAVEIGTRRDT